jgi:hypothetical protein
MHDDDDGREKGDDGVVAYGCMPMLLPMMMRAVRRRMLDVLAYGYMTVLLLLLLLMVMMAVRRWLLQ